MASSIADLKEAQRLYTLDKIIPLCLSDKQCLVRLRRSLYFSKFRTQMEEAMPPISSDSVWYHYQHNPSGTPPTGEKQVYIWQVQPLTEPLDMELPEKLSEEHLDVTPTYYEGTAQLNYDIKPRNL